MVKYLCQTEGWSERKVMSNGKYLCKIEGWSERKVMSNGKVSM